MELFRSKGIVEFYLINHEGFFVTATASGALGLFILQSESEKSASLHDSIKTETQTYYYSFQELPEEQKISLKNVLGFDRLGE
jgi:hypothetical protein